MLQIPMPNQISNCAATRARSEVRKGWRNTTNLLCFVSCPSAQMFSRTCPLGKKSWKENLGKSSNFQKGKMFSVGVDMFLEFSSRFGLDGNTIIQTLGQQKGASPAIPPNRPKWLGLPRQIPLFESGKHDHEPSCSSCPSLSMKEGM